MDLFEMEKIVAGLEEEGEVAVFGWSAVLKSQFGGKLEGDVAIG